MDAQSVKNTSTAAQNGYDMGKKGSGIKRHIAVTSSDILDRRGALQTLKHCKYGLKQVQNLLYDSGYVGRLFAKKSRKSWANA